MKSKDEYRVLEKFLDPKTFEKNSNLLLKIGKLEDRGVDVENLLNQIVRIADSIEKILKTGADTKGLESVIHSLIVREEVHCG